MQRQVIARIESWDARPVSGGYAGLADLAEGGFSGAVESGGTRLFMLNGRIVGVFDGTIEAFGDGDVRAYAAPDPALPLLFAMQERGGEVRGRYYTDDTPIHEVDDTLSSGGFTGVLELSENVLSGDYYVVYYGGRSLSAAFVGNEGRLITGEDAFERADDEVGIYEVRAVDLEVVDVPGAAGGGPREAVATVPGEDAERDDPRSSSAVDDGPADASAADPDDEVGEATDDAPEWATTDLLSPDDDSPPESAESAREAEASTPASDEWGASADEPGDVSEASTEEPTGTLGDAAAADSAGIESERDDVADHAEYETTEGAASETDDGGSVTGFADAEAHPDPTTSAAPGETAAPEEPRPAPDDDERVETGGEDGVAGGRAPPARRDAPPEEPDERFEQEARWREARTVPALDPEESERPVEPEAPPVEEAEPEPDRAPVARSEGATDVDADHDRIEQLEGELAATERERDQLAEQVEAAERERDELEAERRALAERIEDLEAKLAAAEAATGADDTAGGSGQAIDAAAALDQTDLFVRYGSKGRPTLQTAHDGRADPEEVLENLRIESHSRFDAGAATVGGRPFDAFLRDTIQYRFVTWLVEELLYEIQETGTESGLRALYDVLPEIDRAEFNGTVVSRDPEAGETHEESFDVVCRDRMGKPLLVANLNDSLDPASGEMMARLVEDATAAAEGQESLGAAFLVTASFFEPDALETAAEATTGGGFLSRDSRKSFVRRSRNGGYHLCLVEARGQDFHVAVPEF